MNIEYHFSDKCNLNCRSCLHFSSLVKKEIPKKLDQIKKDFNLIFDLTNNGKFINHISLMGGEPLLYKKIKAAINYVGSLFKNSNVPIDLVTNGLLLEKMDDEFFGLIKKFDIQIIVSLYDQNNIKTIHQLLIDRGVRWDSHFMFEDGKRVFNSKYLQLDFNKDYKKKHKNCPMLSNLNLVDGKLYRCAIIAYFKYFDEEFKGRHNIELIKKDYIDLKKIDSYEDLKKKIQKMPHFCGYCRGINHTFEEWDITKKDIEEWVYLDPSIKKI